ncbi:MAG: hypothetical protein M3P06_13690 [Acidobacteriota bacterium]|nr:hypothetical protein [Acidobacteriota bacterium]
MDLALAAMVGIAALWVPGAIATRILRIGSRDGVIRFAQEIAIGLSFWPILFLFTTLAQVSWNANGARVFFVVLVLVLIAIVVRKRDLRPPDLIESIAIVLIAIVAFTRIRQIENIVLPLWVDSVHHTMIVRLLADHGRLPDSYAPFIPQSSFYYHWGFHAVAAFVAWISGLTSAIQVPRLILAFGQLLNVLIFVAVYCAGAALFRNRRTALLAATLATLVSFFPAYYVSWGRYTQLCGLLVLPALASSFWKLGRHPNARRAIEVGLLGAGLVLIHVRVAIFFAILAAILSAILILQRRWKGLAWCAAGGAAALLITAPWIVHVVRAPQVRKIVAPAGAELAQWETSNAAPNDIVWAPHNTFLFSLSSGGLFGFAPFRISTATRIAAIAWWILLVVLLQRKATRKRRGPDRRDGWRMAVVCGWIVITALLINLDRIGLPRMRILTNIAAIITLFLPLSILGAHLIRFVCDEVLPPSRRRSVLLAATLVIALAGASRMLHIVNPDTVLATSADVRALEWIRTHTPPDARFAVGVQPWIGGSYIGIDGGYWIPLIAARESILPPGLYPWVMPPDRVDTITRLLGAWYRDGNVVDAGILDELRRSGVTHFYFGPHNRMAIRHAMGGLPGVLRVYSAENVEIYAIR